MLNRLAHIRTFLVLFIILVAYAIIVMSPAGLVGSYLQRNIPSDVMILDLKQHYTVDEAYLVLDKLGDLGRRDYAFNLRTMDVIFPFLYALTFLSLNLAFLRRISPNNKTVWMIGFVPVLAAACDLGENLYISRLIRAYPEKLPDVAMAANIFTVSKQWLLGAMLFILAIEIVLWLVLIILRPLHRLIFRKPAQPEVPLKK